MLAAFCTERRNIEEKKKKKEKKKSKKRAERRKKFEGGGQSEGSDWLRGLAGMCHSAGSHRLMHACVSHVCVAGGVAGMSCDLLDRVSG